MPKTIINKVISSRDLEPEISTAISRPRLSFLANRYLKRQEAIQEQSFALKTLLFLIVHIPFAILLRQNSMIATAHALGTFGIGLFFLLVDKTPRRVTLVAAYITGAELLWRSSNADVFYEFGKYAIIFLLVCATIKFNLFKNAVKWPVVFFILFIPSIFLLPGFDREAISYNLSGPLALAVATVYFSAQKYTEKEVKQIFIGLLAPMIGLGGLVLFGVVTAESLIFNAASNIQTSAEFGPNQVSSILGLGSLVAFLFFALINKKLSLLSIISIGFSFWLIIQSMLTFSRGGFWNAIGAIFIGVYFLINNARFKPPFVFLAVGVSLIIAFYLLPTLDQFTGNALLARFESFDTTGRVEIVQADLIAFSENPFFGVGPNQSRQYHALTFRTSNAHTEYSRMLAEHGLLGLLSLLILAFASARNFFTNRSGIQKAILLPLMVWGLVFMLHAATRLSAFAFCFGLSFITITEIYEVENRNQKNDPG